MTATKPQMTIIVGAPGTGKTFAVGQHAAEMAQHYGQHNLMICSLTRAGARQACRDIPGISREQMGTVHAHAHRALGAPELVESHLDEWNESYPAYALSGGGLGVDDVYKGFGGTKTGDLARRHMDRCRVRGTPLGSSTLFYERWQDWKAQNGYMDFVDLIEAAMDCDTAPGEPAAILCDEAQDIGGPECRLLLKWGQRAEQVLMAGDSQQAIFEWRGSDALLLQRLWHEHDPKRQPLQQSHRLSQAVFEHAYSWAGRFRFTKRIDFQPRACAGKVVRLPYALQNCSSSRLLELVESTTQGEDTLIVQASCGYMLAPIVEKLRELGVPFHNPSSNQHNWNPLARGKRRGSPTMADRIRAFLHVVGTDEKGRGMWTLEELKLWVAGLDTRLFQGQGRNTLLAIAEGTRMEAVGDFFAACWTPEALRHIVPKPDAGWYLDHALGPHGNDEYLRRVVSRYGADALRETPRVKIGTVHSLKGQEATTAVMCPDFSRAMETEGRLNMNVHEEQLRLFYVGITRARDQLLLPMQWKHYAVRW